MSTMLLHRNIFEADEGLVAHPIQGWCLSLLLIVVDFRWVLASRGPYPIRLLSPFLTSFASSRYAIAPRDVGSNVIIG